MYACMYVCIVSYRYSVYTHFVSNSLGPVSTALLSHIFFLSYLITYFLSLILSHFLHHFLSLFQFLAFSLTLSLPTYKFFLTFTQLMSSQLMFEKNDKTRSQRHITSHHPCKMFLISLLIISLPVCSTLRTYVRTYQKSLLSVVIL